MKDGAPKQYHFVYKKVEYDATDYVLKHPGGREFFDKFLDEKKDLTEYFRTLHSKKALKILKNFPVIKKDLAESQES